MRHWVVILIVTLAAAAAADTKPSAASISVVDGAAAAAAADADATRAPTNHLESSEPKSGDALLQRREAEAAATAARLLHRPPPVRWPLQPGQWILFAVTFFVMFLAAGAGVGERVQPGRLQPA
jgi:hypothetical protein